MPAGAGQSQRLADPDYRELSSLVFAVAAELVEAGSAQLNDVLLSAQRRICESLTMDLSSLYQPSTEIEGALVLTHLYWPGEHAPVPNVLVGTESFPWAAGILMGGVRVIVDSTECLPAEAAVDQESWRGFGIKSSAMFPLKTADGALLGTLSFDHVKVAEPWDPKLLEQLDILASLFAGALSRREAEMGITDAAGHFHQLSDHSLVGIFVEQDNILTYVNDAMADMLGYERAELVGREVLSIVAPDDATRVAAVRQQWLAGDENLPHFVFRAVRKDDSIRDMEIFVARTMVSKRPAALVSMLDITERTRAQAEVELAYDRVTMALDNTIRAISKIVELRDPYTAGHQLRVASLAVALARELGLNETVIEQIHVAALVHDVGKVNIPAEILNRPGHLTEAERQLIQTHCENGFDIVRNIDYPEAVAEAVLQHHERLDGSGYPRHLVGEEVCTEARIIAVADVVEAMSSHRPYRPARGLNEALAEVAAHRGTKFDAVAVDACLQLFGEKGFSFDVPLEEAGTAWIG